jgi:N-carbamoyl-L-amino-acid hydrolase
MKVDRRRLELTLEELSRIGETPRGGLTRLALSDDDRRARDRVVAWMRATGLAVRVDRMGNIFGERPGTEPLPPVMVGSHLDSVPTGGRYDGQLGVLCALEAIRALDDHGVRTRHPITLVVFTNEEGARFQPAELASGVLAGRILLEDAYNARDKDGVRLVDELERIGYLGPEPCAARPMRAYLELHIEQGPLLEEGGYSVGVVEGIVAISWSRVTIRGTQDHAGPTPMRTTRSRARSHSPWTSAIPPTPPSTARSRCSSAWCGRRANGRASDGSSSTTGAYRIHRSTRSSSTRSSAPPGPPGHATGGCGRARGTTPSTWRRSARPG